MKIKHFLTLITALCLMTACGDDDMSPSGYNEGNGNDTSSNVNANDASGNEDLSRWELPHTQDGNLFIAHRTSDGQMNYCLEYNLEANISAWVAYRYDSKLAAQKYPNRTDAWAADPALNNYKEHQLAVGTFKGYQRGHLVGSAERYYSKQANEQTFYMTNMVPMNGAFNTTYWSYIEDLVRDKWGRTIASGDTLYIVKGGTLDRTLQPSVSMLNTQDNIIDVAVPQYYFMALLFRRSGALQAIGFFMEHKDYGNPSTSFLKQLARDCAYSIDDLEEKTGLDFFCNLPDDIEDKVESRYSLSLWNGL